MNGAWQLFLKYKKKIVHAGNFLNENQSITHILLLKQSIRYI